MWIWMALTWMMRLVLFLKSGPTPIENNVFIGKPCLANCTIVSEVKNTLSSHLEPWKSGHPPNFGIMSKRCWTPLWSIFAITAMWKLIHAKLLLLHVSYLSINFKHMHIIYDTPITNMLIIKITNNKFLLPINYFKNEMY